MLILKSPQQLNQVHQPEIKTFLHQRFHDICHPEPYDPEEHGFFILLQAGDTSESIESETGQSPTKSMFTDTVYGDADFTPDFEYVEDHGSFFEAVQIVTDGGFAMVFIIPKEEGIDAAILALCHEFAIN